MQKNNYSAKLKSYAKTGFFSLLTIICLLGNLKAQTVLLSPTGEGGFETGTTFASNGWTTTTTGNNKWYVGTVAFSAGSRGVYVDKNATAGTTNTYNMNQANVQHFWRDIAIPVGATNVSLTFKWKGQGENGAGADQWDFLRVFVVPTTTTPVAGTLLPAGNIVCSPGKLNSQAAFTTQTINLTSFAGTTQRLVFTWNNDGSLGTDPPAAVDEISITYTPFAGSCAAPTGLTASSITTSGATISWTAPAPPPANGYQYVVSTSSTTPSGSGTATTATSVPVSGLSSNTTYYLFVRSICGSPSGNSSWAGPFSFTTLCPLITTVPYSEGFNTIGVYPTCWTSSLVVGTNNWVVAADDGDFIFTPHSGAGMACKNWLSGVNSRALFVSRPINLNAQLTQGVRVNVWIYRNDNGVNADQIRVLANTAPNATGATELIDVRTLITSVPAVPTAGWYNYIGDVPLSFNAASSFYIVFEGTTTMSINSYSVGFDDFVLENVPACPTPPVASLNSINATSASISFTCSGCTGTYVVEYGAPGFTPGSGASAGAGGTIVTGASSPISIGPLNANTNYAVYVRNNCSAANYSSNSAPLNITTPCLAITTLPYSQSFDVIGVTPACWSTALITSDENWTFAANDGDFQFTPHSGAGMAVKNWNSAASDALLCSPPFNTSATPTVVNRINVWIHRSNLGNAADRIRFFVNSTPSTAGATSLLDILTKYTLAPVVASPGWYNYTADIPLLYNNANFYIIAEGNTGGGLQSYSVGFDDFVVEKVLCVSGPSSPANGSSACPTTGSVLSWPAFVGASAYNVYFGTTNPATTLVSPNQAGTTYNAGSLAGGTTYYWSIVPQGIGGTSCSTWSFTLNPVPEPDAQNDGPKCTGDQISLFGDNIDGGQTNTLWSWSGPSSFTASTPQATINSPTAANNGTYTLTITNNFGCTASATTEVLVNPNPVLSIGSQTNVSCNGLSNGLVDINATSGTPQYLFDLVDQFSVPVGQSTTNGIFTGLAAGPYTATITDDNGCTATPLAVTITEPPVLTVGSGSNSPVCEGTALNLNSTPSGGTTGYSYAWTGPNGPVNSVQNPVISSATTADGGQYDLQVTDAHLCTATSSISVTVNPTPLPVITNPGDITVACGEVTALSTQTVTNGSVTCPLSQTSNISTQTAQSPSGPCGGTIIETWTSANDALGRAIVPVSRTITVDPAALPTMTALSDITVACGAIPSPSTISFSNGLSGGCLISGTSDASTFTATPDACGGTVTETWTATDNCGRALASVSRTITVSPAALPTMTAPAAVTVACGSVPAPSTISFSNGLSGGCLISGTSDASTFTATPDACGGTVTETWTATDNCGRALASVSRTITVSPAALPTMTAPAAVTVACGSVPSPSTISFSNGLSGGCLISGTSDASTFTATPDACGGTVTETWTATDNCGRALASVSRTITVSPAALPTMTAPAAVTVACGSVPSPSTISFSNGLSGGCLISGTSDASTFTATPDACGGTVTETWTATDNCGRALASVSRTITVSPAALPTMTAPAAVTVACGSVPSPSTISFSNGLSGGCLISGTSDASTFTATPDACGGTVTETWTATDNCGRALASVSRTITVSPAALPTMTAPAAVTVACGSVPSPSTISFSNGLSGGCLISGTSDASTFTATPDACGGTVTETWTATDNCGRALASVSRTITVSPAALPTMTAPAAVTVACGSVPSPSTISFSNGLSGGCLISGTSDASTFTATPDACGGTVTETWTATDNCGRALASVSRTITVSPAVLPTMTAPGNITVPFSSLPAPGTLPYSNGLSGGCLISGNSNISTYSPAPTACVGSVTQTWTATDPCGRLLASVSRTVTVLDDVPPAAVCQNATVALSAGGTASVTAAQINNGSFDNCGTLNLVSVVPNSFTCANIGPNTVILTVNDGNGNTSTCTATVTAQDLISPTITCPPTVIVPANPGVCYATFPVANLGAPFYGDNCAGATIANNVTSLTQYPVGGTFVQWEVTDVSENKTSCNQLVIVQDLQRPHINGLPSNITFTANPADCTPSISWTAPTASDNCSVSSFTSNYSPGDEFPEGTTTVTYHAIDINGNDSTASFTVTINTVPLAATVSSPTYQCGYNVSCNGGNNGQINTNVSGGCLPYSYSWSNGSTDANITGGLSAGTYTVTVTDDNGHVTTQTITLTQPPALSTTVGPDQSYEFACTCANLVPVTTGGSTCQPYTYMWSTGATSANVTVCPDATVIYTVTVTDINGCTTSDVISVIKPATVGQLDRYSVLGLGTASDNVGNNNLFFNGAAGHRLSTGSITISNNSTVNTFVAGNNVIVGNNSNINTLYRNTASIGSGAVIGTTITPVAIPLTVKIPCFPVFSGGSNVNVPNGGTVTISPGTYNNITTGNNGSTLILNPGIYYVNSISTGNGSSILANGSSTAQELMVFVKTTMNAGNNNVINGSYYSQGAMNLGNSGINNNAVYNGAFLGNPVSTGNNSSFTLASYCYSNLPLCTARIDEGGETSQDPSGKFSLFPNPSNGQITIQYFGETGHDIHVSVLNMVGQVVYERNVYEFTGELQQDFDLNNLEQGVYMIQLKNGNEVINEKFVINR